MPYISASGTIQDKPPWSVGRVTNMFWGFLNLIFMFFKTLINPNFNKKGEGYTSADFRPGPRPPKPPQRRMGGINRGGIDMSACAMGGGG